MALNFNIDPYFDDYDERDKFYRLLFRPGYPVQARELTQMQSILQNQIAKHAEHIFKQGSMVIPGQVSYEDDFKYVKLQSIYNGVDVLAKSRDASKSDQLIATNNGSTTQQQQQQQVTWAPF